MASTLIHAHFRCCKAIVNAYKRLETFKNELLLGFQGNGDGDDKAE